MLDDFEAREIAQDWHGGQWSAFYAFASSGHFEYHGMWSETNSCLNGHIETDEDRVKLDDLMEYVEAHKPLTCPDCDSTNVTPPHGHHLAKCDSCHLAFDTMD